MDEDDQVSLLTRFAIYRNNKAPLVVEEKSTMFYPALIYYLIPSFLVKIYDKQINI